MQSIKKPDDIFSLNFVMLHVKFSLNILLFYFVIYVISILNNRKLQQLMYIKCNPYFITIFYIHLHTY